MPRAVRRLRASYRTGAIVDAIAFLEVLFRGAMQALVGENGGAFETEFRWRRRSALR